MASELVNKLKETLQPESHTAFQGENQRNEGLSNEAYDSSRTENLTSRNEFETPRTSNPESHSFEENLEDRQGEPERPKKQTVKSLLGDAQNIMPHTAPKQAEFVYPVPAYPVRHLTTGRHAPKEPTSFDPRDASRVPPSVFAQYVGEPSIAHGMSSDRARRHSTASHQEAHYNLGSDLK